MELHRAISATADFFFFLKCMANVRTDLIGENQVGTTICQRLAGLLRRTGPNPSCCVPVSLKSSSLTGSNQW